MFSDPLAGRDGLVKLEGGQWLPRFSLVTIFKVNLCDRWGEDRI